MLTTHRLKKVPFHRTGRTQQLWRRTTRKWVCLLPIILIQVNTNEGILQAGSFFLMFSNFSGNDYYCQQNMMQSQHKELEESIWKNYLISLILGLIGLLGLFLYVNSIFTRDDIEYPNHSLDAHRQLQIFIQKAESLGDTIAAVTLAQMGWNLSATHTSKYCTLGLTYEQCVAYQSQFSEREAILDSKHVSTSFRCLSGSCLQVRGLQDYFWTFKLRFDFIDYFMISYSYQGLNSSLIAPSLGIQAFDASQIATLSSWSVLYLNKTLSLSKYYEQGQYFLSLTIAFDTSKLQDKYGLTLDSFDFTKQSYPLLNQKQIHFETDQIWFQAAITVLGFVLALNIGFKVKELITQWGYQNFRNLRSLDSLYRYQLSCIFSGKEPQSSTILSESAMSNFYEDLSQLIDKSYSSLTAREIQKEREQSFKFLGLLEKIKGKFNGEMKRLQEQRNLELSDVKYQIKSAVSDITENVSKRMKESFSRCRELHLTKAFFYYAYLALIEPIIKYQERLKEETMVLPGAVTDLFRYVNQTGNSDDIKYAFKLAFIFPKHIEEELIMKLQFHLQQRYLAIIRELDFGSLNCKQLGLEKEIKYVQENIDNRKYIFITYLK